MNSYLHHQNKNPLFKISRKPKNPISISLTRNQLFKKLHKNEEAYPKFLKDLHLQYLHFPLASDTINKR